MSLNVTIGEYTCSTISDDSGSCGLDESLLYGCCQYYIDINGSTIQNAMNVAYYFILFSFITEMVGIIFAAFIYYCGLKLDIKKEYCRLKLDKESKWKYVAVCTGFFMIISVTLDWGTVAILNENDIINIFENAIANECYTRDAERDVSELEGYFEQMLLFGVVEGITDLIDLGFDIFSFIDDSNHVHLMVIHLVVYVMDVILSLINLVVFAIPAFEQYNALPNDSQCYVVSKSNLRKSTTTTQVPTNTTTQVPTDTTTQDSSPVIMVVVLSVLAVVLWVSIMATCLRKYIKSMISNVEMA